MNSMAQATLIKICGITTAVDASFALDAGADWIGLNFVAGPRKISETGAMKILEQLDDPGRVVALIRVEEPAKNDLVERLRARGVQRVQLYGPVTPDTVARYSRMGFQLIVVKSVPDVQALQHLAEFLTDCANLPPSFVLLDAADARRLGGTGKIANWSAISEARRQGLFKDWPPIIVAGGLDAENVGRAISELSPAGVDVSSGVEACIGRKDHAEVAAFVAAVRRMERPEA